ncbi:phosphonate ABC transporter, permease protein PhnE [Herbivorax sp. ANBcel31]|uniref:phosphonate ABC transporter, permease protein PhnE n=1 Tax=Herbivorax sp. ANBcel31 TaxID=3069754 RepID=UPI0027B59B19|nr:phosphonate ABC transporter, permease protein PhnE [Herbivorax sp. ANBcel31]MDQ2086759.1 phosphonate ABC transporter, permease protein PhnE [Herbivorax sp. ANBcel31]
MATKVIEKTSDTYSQANNIDMSHELYLSYQKNKKNKMYHMFTIWGFGLFIFIWSWLGTDFNVQSILVSSKSIFSFIYEDLIPPDLTVFSSMINPTLDTIYMSIVGVVITIMFSMILAILGAKTTTPNYIIGQVATSLVSFIRAMPSIIIAIFLVAAFGLGVFSGALALGVSGIGMLGKAYIAALEEIDKGQIEALKSVGAKWFHIIGQGVMPQFKPTFIGWSLFQFDLNIRDSAILGMIGAGGLGLALMGNIRLFQYQQASTAILTIFVLIIIVEYITSRLRRKLL